jgi:hypothetical protein
MKNNLETLLNTEFKNFTEKYHGILTMPEIQTLAKFVEEFKENISDNNEESIDISKEKIICSAIWYMDMQTAKFLPNNVLRGVVIAGLRHPNCMAAMTALTNKRSVLPEVGKYSQGFLSNKNNFYNRRDAMEIAYNAGQIPMIKTELYSEDLF